MLKYIKNVKNVFPGHALTLKIMKHLPTIVYSENVIKNTQHLNR